MEHKIKEKIDKPFSPVFRSPVFRLATTGLISSAVLIFLGVFLCLMLTASARSVGTKDSGHLCGNLGGYWVNELNSEMHIIADANGDLTGQYGTAVEVNSGDAGNGAHLLQGRIVGNVVTFNVAWNGGASMTTWIGQCFNHNETDKPQPALLTTWILKSAAKHVYDNWMTNTIGFDTFYPKP